MNVPIEYLDLDDLVDLARALLGDPPPIRDIGLPGAAAARPQTSLLGEDAGPDLMTKAAAQLQSIVNTHALVDGDKRLGWLATAVFLEISGTSASRAHDDVYELVMHVAATNPALDEIVARLHRVVSKPRR